MRQVRIGVVGGRQVDPEFESMALEVGREIARRQGVLYCGGMGGVMASACKGAKELGGLTVGLLPGDSATEANPWVSVPIVTGLQEGRNLLIVRSSEVLIAIDGSYGTLIEIAFALHLGVPVVALSSWTVTRSGLDRDPIERCKTPLEAVGRAFALAGKRREGQLMSR